MAAIPFVDILHTEELNMEQNYEYKFVRLGEGHWWAKKRQIQSYQDVVHQHAQDGWRLVQVFAPSLGAYGAAKFFELIFEKPVN